MKKLRLLLFSGLLALLSLTAAAYDRIAVVGNPNTDFRASGLMENRFDFKEKLVELKHVKACEAIDNSMMVVFDDQIPAATLEEWFGNDGIRQSLHELLRRGGVLYFGCNSWTNYNAGLPRTRDFFTQHKMAFPIADVIGDFVHPTIKDFPKDSVPVNACQAAFLREPFNFETGKKDSESTLTGIRYFNQWNVPGLQTFFATPEGEPTIVGFTGVEGKGTVIFSFCFSPVRVVHHKLFDNLIKFGYGELKELSASDIAAQEVAKLMGKGNNAKSKSDTLVPPILPMADTLETSQKLVLLNHKGNKPVKLITEAHVFGNAKRIYVQIKCNAPDADKINNKCAYRDEAVWTDDAVNIMFSPDDDAKTNYFFLINSSGAVYDAKGGSALWNGEFELKTQRFADRYEIEFSVDPAQFGIDLAKTGYCLFNVGREGTPTQEVTSVYPGYNDPTQYAVLGPGDEKTVAAKYAEAHQPLTADTPYIIWTDDPYKKKFTNTMPKQAVDQSEVKLTVARNDAEAAALFVTNITPKALVFRMEPDFKLSNGAPFTDLLEVKEVIPRLNPLNQPQFDAISKLNEAGTITVPGFETKILWLDVKTMLPAGTYEWNLECVPTLTHDMRKKFHVTVEVLDYEIPAKLHARAFGFGPYIFSYAEGRTDAYFQAMRDHLIDHVITGYGMPAKAVRFDDTSRKVIVSDNLDDYAMEEDYMMANGWTWFYSYGTYWPFREVMQKLGKDKTIFDPEFKALYGKFLRNWAAYFKKNNIPFNRFYVEVFDEVRPEFYDEYVEAGVFMKKTVPEFQMFGTLATWFDAKELPRFNQFMDLYVPWEPRITERASGKEELQFYQSCGKQFMPYLCSINIPLQSMQNYFRFRGIRTYLMGTDFISQWGFNSWNDNQWFPEDKKQVVNSFMFYHGNNGPIVCPRMEAFREAVEDLHLLLEAEKVLQTQSDAELARLIAPETLNEVMKADSEARTYEWRTALLRRLTGLKKK